MGKKSISKKEKRLRKYNIKFYEEWREMISDILKYPKLNEDVRRGLEDALAYVDERIEEVKKQTTLIL